MLSTTLALGLLGALVPRAHAQSEGAEPRERALVLFEAAELRYQEARFEDAVELLVEARDLYDEAVISYNLGRAYEELGRFAEAAEAFRHYLERAPDAQDRRLVEARIERLDAQVAGGVTEEPEGGGGATDGSEAEVVSEDESPSGEGGETPPVDEGPSRGPSIPAVIVAGLGALGLGAGVAFGSVSQSLRQDAVDDPVHETSRASFRDAESMASIANVMFAIGGVVLAAGLTWLILDLVLAGDDEDELALSIGPGSISLRGALP